jgi:hypothetical protein
MKNEHHKYPSHHRARRMAKVAKSTLDFIGNNIQAPSDYFSEIKEAHGANETIELMNSHMLPTGKDSPIFNDNFEAFLDWREANLTDLILKRTKN